MSRTAVLLCVASAGVAWAADRPPCPAAYIPGIDVHGRPVVAADVAAASVTASEVTIDPARYGLALPEGITLTVEGLAEDPSPACPPSTAQSDR